MCIYVWACLRVCMSEVGVAVLLTRSYITFSDSLLRKGVFQLARLDGQEILWIFLSPDPHLWDSRDTLLCLGFMGAEFRSSRLSSYLQRWVGEPHLDWLPGRASTAKFQRCLKVAWPPCHNSDFTFGKALGSWCYLTSGCRAVLIPSIPSQGKPCACGFISVICIPPLETGNLV